MLQKLSSRKLWAAVASAAAVAFATELGLDQTQSMEIVGIVVAYLIGQGIADGRATP